MQLEIGHARNHNRHLVFNQNLNDRMTASPKKLYLRPRIISLIGKRAGCTDRCRWLGRGEG